jgi:hypothetical protein
VPQVAILDVEPWDMAVGGMLKLWDATDKPLVMLVKFVIVVSLVISRDIFCGVGLTVDGGPVWFPPREAIILLKESMSKLRFTGGEKSSMLTEKPFVINHCYKHTAQRELNNVHLIFDKHFIGVLYKLKVAGLNHQNKRPMATSFT